MVPFAMFRSRQFSGANAVTLLFYAALSGVFFLLVVHLQTDLGYSALEAGAALLPVTACSLLLSPHAGALSQRIGPRIPMTVGLTIVAFALYLQTGIKDGTGYGHLLPAFVLMGIGMALTMSPMSTAAMNAVEVTKAGVASGILSMNRMVGGTLGVALLGTIFQSVSKSRLTENLAHTPLPAGQRAALADQLGQGASSVHATNPAMRQTILHATHDAFIHGFTTAMIVSTSVAALGAVVAFTMIGRVRRPQPQPEPVQQAEASAQAEALSV